MHSQTSLNLFQRSVAMGLAAVVTLSLLSGINHLAHQAPAAEAWAGHGAVVQPA